MKDCAHFDFVNGLCLKCFNSTYLTDSTVGLCCPLGYIEYDNRCVKNSKLNYMDKCLNYNNDDICVDCKLGYTSHNGICCPEDYYLDIGSLECKHY